MAATIVVCPRRGRPARRSAARVAPATTVPPSSAEAGAGRGRRRGTYRPATPPRRDTVPFAPPGTRLFPPGPPSCAAGRARRAGRGRRDGPAPLAGRLPVDAEQTPHRRCATSSRSATSLPVDRRGPCRAARGASVTCPAGAVPRPGAAAEDPTCRSASTRSRPAWSTFPSRGTCTCSPPASRPPPPRTRPAVDELKRAEKQRDLAWTASPPPRPAVALAAKLVSRTAKAGLLADLAAGWGRRRGSACSGWPRRSSSAGEHPRPGCGSPAGSTPPSAPPRAAAAADGKDLHRAHRRRLAPVLGSPDQGRCRSRSPYPRRRIGPVPAARRRPCGVRATRAAALPRP
ncbi:hypothetical protein HBB16_02970 [Pseudonocardia sp. MCCB 268]|nr:hypothetical protein [Pseudonocardia cytotoxica]